MSAHMMHKLIFDVLQYLSDAGVVHLDCSWNIDGQHPDALFHERDSKVLVLKGEENRFNLQDAIVQPLSARSPITC